MPTMVDQREEKNCHTTKVSNKEDMTVDMTMFGTRFASDLSSSDFLS